MKNTKSSTWRVRALTPIALLVLASCGGGDDGPAALKSGVFIDAAVQGLYYESHPSGQKGTTDADGTFRFAEGDQVTFYLITNRGNGDMQKLGTALAAEVLTPIDITRHQSGMLTDVLQVLQSLDADGDASNGITLNDAPPRDCSLEDQSGCRVSPEAAKAHFANQLEKFGLPAKDTFLGQRSVWKTQMDKPGCLITRNDACYRIKGITYSPAPVGYDVTKAPALGDLFWDSFKAPDNVTQIYNWFSLWGKGDLGGSNGQARDDLGTIKALGVNTIRVYAMLSRQLVNGKAPALDERGQVFTHEQFLDQCAVKGLSVLVDIPLPDTMLWRDKYQQTQMQEPTLIAYWDTVVKEVAEELKANPAVMGFSIMNEKDGHNSAFMQDGSAANANTDFFYYQAIKYARIIKQIAPDKLVGWAIHDSPTLVGWASTHRFTDGELKGKIYFEELAKVFDYWGVNTYQLQVDQTQPTLRPVLGNGPSDAQDHGKTYNTLPQQMKRPVILTEWGWPGTGREGDAKDGAIIETEQTRQKTAEVISWAFQQAYGETDYPQYGKIKYDDILAGAFFFSFSHEWWKSGDANTWNATQGQSPVANFPNHFWEEEGFGLFKIQQPGRKGDDGGPWCSVGPCLPYDRLAPMSPMTDALKQVYSRY